MSSYSASNYIILRLLLNSYSYFFRKTVHCRFNKKHFCLQLFTVLALQAQIDLSLEVQENVPIPVTNTLKIVQNYENLSIITAAKSSYLWASLSTDHPSSYNSILASSRVRSQVPILYDLLGRSATKLISTSNLCHRFSTNTNQNSVWTNPYRLILSRGPHPRGRAYSHFTTVSLIETYYESTESLAILTNKNIKSNVVNAYYSRSSNNNKC